MNPNLDLDQLRSQLSLTKAPLVMKNLEVVVDFFKKTLRVSPFSWIPYLKGIDFSKPVEPVQLHPGCEVVRHKPDDSKPKPFCYLTVVGSSPMRTGTNFCERYVRTIPGLHADRRPRFFCQLHIVWTG